LMQLDGVIRAYLDQPQKWQDSSSGPLEIRDTRPTTVACLWKMLDFFNEFLQPG
jgi:hypothetical protein